MGSPLSSILAEVVMNEMDEQVMNIMKSSFRLWKRYVDDILAIIKLEQLSRIMLKLNRINSSIQFTNEVETDNQLPFLDFMIRRLDGKLEFSVYRKPTHSGRYLSFDSEHTLNQKLSVIRSLTHRAHTHSSTQSAIDEEFRTIEREMCNNNFPRKIVQEEITQSTKRYKEKIDFDTQPDEAQPKTVAIPFVENLSYKITRILKKVDIRTVMIPGISLKNILCTIKDKIPNEETSNCIYQIGCTECDASYTGETKRRIKNRMTEHRAAVRNGNDKDSALAEHAINKLHPPDWASMKIVSKARDFRTRRFKEATEILNQPNPLNRNEGMKIPDIFKPLVVKNIDLNLNKFRAKTNCVRFLPNW
jgi:hypothetical protein